MDERPAKTMALDHPREHRATDLEAHKNQGRRGAREAGLDSRGALFSRLRRSRREEAVVDEIRSAEMRDRGGDKEEAPP